MAEPPLVVVADPIDARSIDRLRAGPCRVVDATENPAALGRHLEGAWGLVVRSRTKVTQAVLEKAPHLELIARAGVGIDNVDLDAATRRQIRVVNVPSAATESVAELALTQYLLLVRKLLPAVESTRAGRWERGAHGHELAGRTVGFVGYGRIARAIARRLVPFGCPTLAYDPFVARSDDATRMVPLPELLGQSDIVSLHAALTPSNRHLIDGAAFAAMKPGAFLVNVARGPLVDESALLDALRSGRLAGAALDVYEVEPPANPELVHHPNVIPTPHIGAATVEAQARAGAGVVDEVLRALRGEPLTAQVRPEGSVA